MSVRVRFPSEAHQYPLRDISERVFLFLWTEFWTEKWSICSFFDAFPDSDYLCGYKKTDMKIVKDTFNCGVRYIAAETEGVCSYAIELKIFGDEILDVTYYGGCNGNLKGIAALAKGHKISDVQQRLSGITCGNKKTSCPDQLAQLLQAIQQ